jgi:hypothetical protein
MSLFDWLLVVLGAAIALCGGWIQLNAQQLYPRQLATWGPDRAALAQIRRLGASILFMGIYFSMQMTVDLVRLPWWVGSLMGLPLAILAVRVNGRTCKRRGERVRRANLEQQAAAQ